MEMLVLPGSRNWSWWGAGGELVDVGTGFLLQSRRSGMNQG